jgi:hypothetical protein
MPAPITTTSAEPLRSSLRNVVAGAVAVQQESGLPKSLIEMEVLRGRVRVRKPLSPVGCSVPRDCSLTPEEYWLLLICMCFDQ